MVNLTDLHWLLLASASKFSYSSLEQLCLNYQSACFKFGLAPALHIRLSQVANDEFRLCISMKLSQLVDENINIFTQSPYFLIDT